MKSELYLLMFVLFCVFGCHRDDAPPLPVKKAATLPKVKQRAIDFVEDESINGLQMVLKEASLPKETSSQRKTTDGVALSDEETTGLFHRATQMNRDAEDIQEFSIRGPSQPAPRPGDTVTQPFPIPEKIPAPSTDDSPGVLNVQRFAPEGNIQTAPHLSITFSKPMVPVTAQNEAAKTVPVTLTPTPNGSWRWLGTQTLVFKPENRFPMATKYQVTIPKGIQSINGDVLEADTQFSFQTPSLKIENWFPDKSTPQKRTPVIFIQFNQAVSEKTLLPFIELRAKSQKVDVRMATKAERDADETLQLWTTSPWATKIVPTRSIALVPTSPLPQNSRVVVTVKKGAASAEGPNVTNKDQDFEFSTFGPLKMVSRFCEYPGSRCAPDESWHIEFNNPLKKETVSASTVRVTPQLEDFSTEVVGSTIVIRGEKQGRTSYQINLDAGITDRFGQTLGQSQTMTFKVGSAFPQIEGPGKSLVTLDPFGPKTFNVFVTNHKAVNVRIHRVTPSDWTAWYNWRLQHDYFSRRQKNPLPGQLLKKKKIRVDKSADKRQEVAIPLDAFLEKGFGHFIVYVEQTAPVKDQYTAKQWVASWVQVTDIGLTAFLDSTEMVGVVTSLKDGAPLKGVTIELHPDMNSADSDALGMVKLSAPKGYHASRMLVARMGGDVAILPEESVSIGRRAVSGWDQVNLTDTVRWYTFDDRGMYRPGETARVKGWLRRFEPKVGGDIGLLKHRPKTLKWTFMDSIGNEISKGAAPLSRFFGFDIKIEIPKDINLGKGMLNLELAEAGDIIKTRHTHFIEVQEFRRPEFEIELTAPPGPFVLGEEAVLSVKAAYFSGGGLSDAPVTWTTTAKPGHFTPPNRENFLFGEQLPWWKQNNASMADPQRLTGETRMNGEHHLNIHFKSMNPPSPTTVRVEASVMDVNRQNWSKSTHILVHPANRYVGLKTKSGFSEKGHPFEVTAIVTDLEGTAIPGVDIDVTMTHVQRDQYRYRKIHETDRQKKRNKEPLDEQHCHTTSSKHAVPCTFTPKIGGLHTIVATIKDEYGRTNRTLVGVLVSGGDTAPSRNVEREEVLIIPEKKEVYPEETARFMIQAPFYPAEGILLTERSGIETQKRFTMDAATKTFEIPITEAHVPNLTVQVEIVGVTSRKNNHGKKQTLDKRTAFASGTLTFTVPPIHRTLKVAVTPKHPTLAPGGKTVVDIDVKDAGGAPVKEAELVIVAADEAVLALSDYRMPDPIEVFYAARNANVATYHSRSQLVLAPDSYPSLGLSGYGRGAGGLGGGTIGLGNLNTIGHGGGGSGYAGDGQPEEKRARRDKGGSDRSRKHIQDETKTFSMRRDFDALALFETGLTTDAKGHATATLTLPDSLTRYRLMAVAVSGENRFGKGESSVTARLPLMVRPSAPRFLNFTDRFELPVVVQNQTDNPMTVDVGVRGSNILLSEKQGAPAMDGSAKTAMQAKRVDVPANDRIEVRFPAAAAMAGTARFQVVASSANNSDASAFELPVYTPATTEAFATYGVIDEGIASHKVLAPASVWPQFGGLELSTSSTQLQALTDAFVYLVHYPFDCSEQIASRLIAIIALKDVLTAFKAQALPKPEKLLAFIDADIQRLATRQGYDGGFGFWRKDKSWPYLTVHVANALAQTKAAGYTVPPDMWNRVQRYLRNIHQHIPGWYSKKSRWSIMAYAAHVQWKMRDPNAHAAAKSLFNRAQIRLPIEAMGWVLPVLFDAKAMDATTMLLRYLDNHVTETAASAHFITDYSDGAQVLLHSERRVDGILLEALIHVDKENDLIPKLVNGLLAHQTKGRWESTQENTFVLSALDKYFKTFEKVTPDFVARAWLGNRFVMDHPFKGRSTKRARTVVPMATIQENKAEQNLIIQKTGSGRLYYRLGMRYAPRDLNLPPADFGFGVTRTYEAVEDENDVKKVGDVWHIKAGATVRVRLTMVAPTRRYHVALVDPLPAGLEPLNPTLAVSPRIPNDPQSASTPNRYWWWNRAWYEHQNLRDERVEAFTSLLWEGVHTYTYVARATTLGTFIVPPTKAEEMYHPETFGRSGTDHVVVE